MNKKVVSRPKKYYPLILLGMVIVLIFFGAIVLFVSQKNFTAGKNIDSNSSTSKVAEDDSNVISNEVDLSNLKIYFSIANSPDEKFIKKTFDNIEFVEVETLVQNAPNVKGSCTNEIYKLEGVSTEFLGSLDFEITPTTLIANSNFELENGTYRSDIICKFNEKKYSVTYTIDITINTKELTPVSYAI